MKRKKSVAVRGDRRQQYDEFGRELPDATKVEVPLNFRRPPTIQEQIRQFVRSEVSRAAQEQGFESFEDADDFDVDDYDPDPLSPYELSEMQEEAQFRDASDLEKGVDRTTGPASIPAEEKPKADEQPAT